MSALTTPRTGASRLIFRAKRPLAADAKVFKGATALAILSGTSKGFYEQGKSSAIGIVKGRFLQTVDNTGGADGAKMAEIDFSFSSPAGRKVYLLDNDTGSAVDETDREGGCYVLDDHTVSMTVSTAEAGVVYDVTDEGVWVEMAAGAGAESASGLSDIAPVDPSSSAASAGVAALAARQDHAHHIAVAIPAAEGLMSGAQAGTISPPAATTTAIKAIAAANRANGMLVMCLADGSFWRFHSTSTAADTSENLVLVPGVGSGRWLRADSQVLLSLAFTFATADNATLFTVPVGCRLAVRRAWWDIATSMTGGSSSAVGLHASPAGFSTKGDLLGGSAGDTDAGLVSTNTRMQGTVGTTVTSTGRLLLIAADTIKYDRITSVHTAGSGNARVLVDVLANPGA